MKKLMAAGLISLMAFNASAGGITYEPPAVVEIEEPTTMNRGSGAWLIPLVILAVIVLAFSQDEEVAAISDSRLKTDIVPLGVAANGLPLFSFRYIGLPQVYSGVMAQDVLLHTPEAVNVGLFGFMTVNYEMLGLKMGSLN